MAEILTLADPSEGQIAALAETLADGFAPDPVWSWMFPFPKHRAVEMRAYFRSYLAYAAATGAVLMVIQEDDSDTFDAAFVYYPVGGPFDEHGKHNELRLEQVQAGCPTSYEHLMKAEETLARYRPTAPHLYSTVLAVRPGLKGQGHGRQLWKAFAAIADREGVGAYGEATTPSNFRWESTILGANLFDAPVHIADNPTYPVFYPMWRTPLATAAPVGEDAR